MWTCDITGWVLSVYPFMVAVAIQEAQGTRHHQYGRALFLFPVLETGGWGTFV